MALGLNHFDAYVTPIPGPNPSGEDLRYTPVYDQIKEAKRSDDLLDKGEWETELKTSDWRLAKNICSEALIHKTKDLQIAAWLTESMLHLEGFSGLISGLQILAKLIADFWDTLYPEVEDGDLGFRAGPVTYLNEKLPMAVFQVPICDPEHSKAFTYFEWEESRLVGIDSGLDKEQKDRRQEKIDEGKISAEEFKTAVNLSAIGFYKTLFDDLTACRDQVRVLDEIVTQQFGSDAPGLTRLSEAVASVLRVVEKIYVEKRKSEVADIENDDLGEPLNDSMSAVFPELDGFEQESTAAAHFSTNSAISDISGAERAIWKKVVGKAGNGHLKGALDQLMAAAALAPSVRQKNRYLLLVAKLCLKAGRRDLAQPIVEELYALIETLKLEKWEHPAWIADVIETLYRCLDQDGDGQAERAILLFQKLCTLNITKAATYRMGGMG